MRRCGHESDLIEDGAESLHLSWKPGEGVPTTFDLVAVQLRINDRDVNETFSATDPELWNDFRTLLLPKLFKRPSLEGFSNVDIAGSH